VCIRWVIKCFNTNIISVIYFKTPENLNYPSLVHSLLAYTNVTRPISTILNIYAVLKKNHLLSGQTVLVLLYN